MAPALAPETLAKLKSLGYVGGASSATGKLADPKDQIALYRRYQDALELQASGRIAESAAGLIRVVSADPAIVGARIELGLTLQRLHRDSDAVKEFESALKVDPRNALVHFNLGVSLSNLGNNEKAERELDLATAIQPSFSRAFVARGLALARLGKLREGVASLTMRRRTKLWEPWPSIPEMKAAPCASISERCRSIPACPPPIAAWDCFISNSDRKRKRRPS